MKKRPYTILATFVLIGSMAVVAQAQQGAPPVLLEIFVENRAFYVHDQPDYSKLASDPNPVFPIGAGKTFTVVTGIGDITAMNGHPAKGTFATWFTVMNLRPQPAPGQAIADVTRPNMGPQYFEILDENGTSLGTLALSGWGGGPPAPGAPPQIQNGSFVISGGTGIFLGAQGQAGQRPGISGRAASTNEDPSLRRAHGGGNVTVVFAFVRNSCPYATVEGKLE